MTLLLCTILFCVPFVCASLTGLNDTHILTLDASNCPSCNTRTLWDILSSCGLTLFACTWTAMHLDIPGRDEGIRDIFIHRLSLVVLAFLAPELVVGRAVWEYLLARNLANEFNSEFGLQRIQPRSCYQAIRRKLVNMILGGSTNLDDGQLHTQTLQ
ncbi:hypothetical protein BD769DRAFT_1357792 [Suillus cothurnatus]|nr:hypothetical protein BD769DRAFT_1357792 [Suillus cothurnatus]